MQFQILIQISVPPVPLLGVLRSSTTRGTPGRGTRALFEDPDLITIQESYTVSLTRTDSEVTQAVQSPGPSPGPCGCENSC
eukprot:1929838-Rhodomonas_salina.1